MHRQCWISGVHGCGIRCAGGVGDIGDVGLGGVVCVDVGGDGDCVGYFSLLARGSSTGFKASGSTQKPPAGQGHCHMALFDPPFLKTMNVF